MSFRTLSTLSIHPPGVGDLDVLPNNIAVTCGEDGYVCFTDLNELKEIRSMRIVTDDGTVPSISVSPSLSADGTHRDVFVASSDNYLLNRYSLGAKATFEGCYLRCTEDIKHIACSNSYVAVVSEDLKSRVVVRANMERVLILEGHKEPVKSVAIDPLETYVATSAADSTVKIFNIRDVDGDTGEVVASGTIPTNYSQSGDEEILARIAWQPGTGALLAIPQRMNTIGLYERDTWKQTSKLVFPSFDGVVNADVNIIAFSQDGKYIAAASMAKQIFVWDISKQTCIASFECDDSIIALSWLLDSNGFAVLTSSGSVGHALRVAPSSNEPSTSTSAPVPTPAPAPVEPAPKPIPTTAADDDNEDDSEMQVNAIKRSFGFDPDMAVLPTTATIDDEDLDPSTQAAMDAPLLSSGVVSVPVATAQSSFQSGAVLQGPIILLAWNLLGDIESLTSADQSALIVLRFNDKSKRGFKFHDTYNFTMADFDDIGAIFGAPAQDDIPSVISYRAVESWTSNSAWHISLPEGEDVFCVTTAGSMCAVGTSKNFIRVYSQGGVLLSIFALPGRIVTLASHESGKLGVIYAVGATLHYCLYSLQPTNPRVQLKTQGILPLGRVEWFGFNDSGTLFCVEASTGIVFALSNLVGLQWMPLVQPSHTHGSIFCVGIRDSTVFFLPKILDQPLHLPRKHRPVLSTWSYDRVEEDALWPAHKSAQTLLDSDAQDVTLQAAADKALILRIKAACASDEIQRAFDLATCLSLEKSFSIAQQIAMHFGFRELHARLGQVQAEQFPHEDIEDDYQPRFSQPDRSSIPRRSPEPSIEARSEPASQSSAKKSVETSPAPPPSGPKPFVNPFKKRTAPPSNDDDNNRKKLK